MAISDFDQALAYANESDYGLCADVFARDIRKIIRCVNELEFGENYINRPSGEARTVSIRGTARAALEARTASTALRVSCARRQMYNNYA